MNESRMIRSIHELAEWISELGFLSLFRNDIEGFSVDEHTPQELWFADGVDGPWEWKGPAIRQTDCAYGKFFRGKAGFISADWFPDFANYRRVGYDFDARYKDGLASYRDKMVYEIIEKQGSLLSKEVKRLGDSGKTGVRALTVPWHACRCRGMSPQWISSTLRTGSAGHMDGEWRGTRHRRCTLGINFHGRYTREILRCQRRESFSIWKGYWLFPEQREKVLKMIR